MADGIKISGKQGENVDELGREHSEKLQAMARSLISGLYMLIRSVKMYDPDNAVFEKPLLTLEDTINTIISKEGKLELIAIKDSFYLNNMLVKVDLAALDNLRYLIGELRSKDVGGFELSKPITATELKNFVWIFSKEQTAAASEEGLANRKLLSMKVAKWSKLREKLSTEKGEPGEQGGKIDRKKYAMTIYARAVIFLEKYLESLRKGQPIDTRPALKLVQEFIDISYEHRTHFLGMTSLRRESDYLVFHQVNVCLMSIVLGIELGLTKAQLRDLGYTAMFHDAGMATVPEEITTRKGALPPEDRAVLARAPLISVKAILQEKSLNRTTLMRLVTTFEHKQDFGTAVRDAQGNIQMIIPRTSLGVYAKILAICDAYDALTSKRSFREAYGPEVALMLMWTEMRHKFDPELLTVFMRVMSIQPVKILSKRQQKLSMDGL